MHLTEVAQAPCISCGQGNTPTRDRVRRQFVDLERDVNWNDPVLLCEDCILKLGGLIGMPSPDTLSALRMEIVGLREERHALSVRIDEMKQRGRRLGIEFTDEPIKKKGKEITISPSKKAVA